jgi:hypothetical protein
VSKPISSILLAALLAAVLVATGCGDDTLTKAELIEQADVVCRKADEKKGAALEAYLLKLNLPYGKTMSQAQLEYQVKKVTMPPVRSAVEQINDLGSPDEGAEEVTAIVESMKKAIKQAERESETTVKPGPEGYPDPFEHAAALSRDFGFKTCFVNY